VRGAQARPAHLHVYGPTLGGFGFLGLGCDDSRYSPGHGDKGLRMVRGAYYGHPNRNRAREDSRQSFYYRGLATSTQPTLHA